MWYNYMQSLKCKLVGKGNYFGNKTVVPSVRVILNAKTTEWRVEELARQESPEKVIWATNCSVTLAYFRCLN